MPVLPAGASSSNGTYPQAVLSNPVNERRTFPSYGGSGASLTVRSTSQYVDVGATIIGNDGYPWTYVSAASTSSAGATVAAPAAVGVTVTLNADQSVANAVVATGTGYHAFAPFSAGQFGWVRNDTFI